MRRMIQGSPMPHLQANIITTRPEGEGGGGKCPTCCGHMSKHIPNEPSPWDSCVPRRAVLRHMPCGAASSSALTPPPLFAYPEQAGTL